MKCLFLLPALLLAAPVAYAQKAKDFAQFDAVAFSLVPGKEAASLYYTLADTTAKHPPRLPRTYRAVVVGEFSPRWAVIRHNGLSYFIRQAELAGLAPSQTVKQVAASIDAPLPLDGSTNLIDFNEVVQVPGATKDELYARGKVWFANAFKSTQKAIQADDKEAGILIGRGWQPAYVPNAFGNFETIGLWYTVKFAFKDGRYRYTITNLEFDYPAVGYAPNSPPLPAEPIAFATRKDGKPTTGAKAHTRALNQAARSTGQYITFNMSKPAVGNDF